MTAQAALQERLDFAKRLRTCMIAARYSADSPTVLMRQFNLGYEGGQSLSVHAVRKWLLGLAIPSQDKLRVLADWLGVLTEWLRFGEEAAFNIHDDATAATTCSTSTDKALLDYFHRLDAKDQELVFQLVQSLGKASQRKDEIGYRSGFKVSDERSIFACSVA